MGIGLIRDVDHIHRIDRQDLAVQYQYLFSYLSLDCLAGKVSLAPS